VVQYLNLTPIFSLMFANLTLISSFFALCLASLQAQNPDFSGHWEGFVDQSKAASRREGYNSYWADGLWKKGEPTAKLWIDLYPDGENKYKGVYKIGFWGDTSLNASYQIHAYIHNGQLRWETDSAQAYSSPFCFNRVKLIPQNLHAVKDSNDVLAGSWEGWSGWGGDCAKGAIVIQRPRKPIDKPIEPTDSSKFEFPPNQPIPTRKLSEKTSIRVKKPTVEIAIWDKNRIDGDTVKLFWNGQLLLDNWGLTAEKKIIRLDLEQTDNILLMQAVNLGTIPPNTATISVSSGNQRQTIELNSDMHSSELIKINLKP